MKDLVEDLDLHIQVKATGEKIQETLELIEDRLWKYQKQVFEGTPIDEDGFLRFANLWRYLRLQLGR